MTLDDAVHNCDTTQPPETGPFAAYLARQLVAQKGYSHDLTVAELEPARAACDYLLIRHDGMQFSAICIVDCEADATHAFGLSVEQARDAIDACRGYAGRMGFSRMPVQLHVIEVRAGAVDTPTRQRLAAYKRRSIFSKGVLNAWALDTANASVWSNAPAPMRWGLGRWFKGLLACPRRAASPDADGQRLRAVTPGWPWLSFLIAAALIAVYGLQILFAIPPGNGVPGFDTQTLFALGGLNPAAVFGNGEWYRLASAIMLHGGLLHLLFNLVALLLAGFSAERLMGSAWFAATFALGGASGAALSLYLGPPGMVAVGASGAIMALLAAGLICSFRLVDNAERLQVQMRLMFMLIPSLIPSATSHAIGGATDYAAHFGGALAGALIGILLRAIWRRHGATPPGQALAALVAGAALLLLAGSATAVAKNYPRYADVVEYIPADAIPDRWSDLSANEAANLVAAYPEDPRGHYTLGRRLLIDERYVDAERAFRDALAAYRAHADDFLDAFEPEVRMFIALSLALQGQSAEARREAAPLCAQFHQGEIHQALAATDLCKPADQP